jgi:hypothetical protein
VILTSYASEVLVNSIVNTLILIIESFSLTKEDFMVKISTDESLINFNLEFFEKKFSQDEEEKDVILPNNLKKHQTMSKRALQVFEESINYPFMERQDIYLPIFKWGNNESLAKWDVQANKFVY